jgi:hypothetical protein
MAVARLLVLTTVGLAIAGCAGDSLPKPLYALQPVPPPYRKAVDGAIIDNEDIRLDAEGYRIDSNGNRIREVDVGAKLSGQTSNPVAGYYISSIGANASGSVMRPSEGAGVGVGVGPGSAYPMPSGDPMVPVPPPIQ